VYGDCTSAECSELSSAYARLKIKPSFVGARARVPIVATWDDHDIGMNDAWPANPYKDIAKQMFVDFFELAEDDPRRARGGVYMDYSWGPEGQRTQLLLLDTRYYRSAFAATDGFGQPFKERYLPDNDASKTMLGDEQWQWLEQKFQETADLRILVSSVQVVADGHGWECWRMLPRERQRLYDLISDAGGVTVILSGDRHVGGFYKSPVEGILDVTASSLTHSIPFGAFTDCTNASTCDEAGPNRLYDLVRANHFGTVDVDWSARSATVSLRRSATSDRIFQESDAGEALQSYTVAF